MKGLLRIRKFDLKGEYRYEDRDRVLLRAYDAGKVRMTSENDNDFSPTPLDYAYETSVRDFS